MTFSYSEEPLALNTRGADGRRAVSHHVSVDGGGGERMSMAQKARLFRQLWPYIVPLITVRRGALPIELDRPHIYTYIHIYVYIMFSPASPC
jgi:hypothetical protein